MKALVAFSALMILSAPALADEHPTRTVSVQAGGVANQVTTDGGAGTARGGVLVKGELSKESRFRYGESYLKPEDVSGFDDSDRLTFSLGIIGARPVGSVSYDMLWPCDLKSKVCFETRQGGRAGAQSYEVSPLIFGARFGSLGPARTSLLLNPAALYGEREHGTIGGKSSVILEGNYGIGSKFSFNGRLEAGIIYGQAIQGEKFETISDDGQTRTQKRTQNEIKQSGVGTTISQQLELNLNDLITIAGVPVSLALDGTIEDIRYKTVENTGASEINGENKVQAVTGMLSAKGVF